MLAAWTGTAWRSTDPSDTARARGARIALASRLERLDVRIYASRAEAVRHLVGPVEAPRCPCHQPLDDAWADDVGCDESAA